MNDIKYNNDKIDSNSYMILIILTSRVIFNGIGFVNMLTLSKNDVWISAIIGTIIGFFIIYVITKSNKKDTSINLFTFLFICISFIITLNDFVNFSSIKYLFETPKLVIAFLYIIPLLYICNKGVETIGRSAIFMFYISILIYITISITLTGYIKLDYIKPILSNDITNILYSGIKYTSYIISPIILVNMLPKGNENIKVFNKKLIIAYFISSFSVFITLIYTLTVYDYLYTSLFNYPIYFLLKKIEYDFISNAENILSLLLIIDYFYTMLLYMYLINSYFKTRKNKKYKNITYYVFILILLLISVYLKDIKLLNYLKNDIYSFSSIIFIVVFLLTRKK